MTSAPQIAFVGPVDGVPPWLLRAIGQAGAQFVGLCDPDPARAEQAAGEYHARWPFAEIKPLLAEAQPQGVIVATPMSVRDDVIRRCMTAGASVLVFGLPLIPPGRMALRGSAFVWSAAASRYAPAGLLVRRLLESGKIGEILSVDVSATRWRAARGVAEAGWPVSPDVIFDAMDWIESIVGPLREVFARGHPDGGIAATLVSRQDVPVSLTLHEHGTPESAGLTMELRGTDGTLLTLDRQMRLDCRSGTRVVAAYAPSLGVSDPAIEFGYVGLIREFLQRLAHGPARNSDIGWATPARSTQAILDALSKSGPIRLDKPARAGAKVAT